MFQRLFVRCLATYCLCVNTLNLPNTLPYEHKIENKKALPLLEIY